MRTPKSAKRPSSPLGKSRRWIKELTTETQRHREERQKEKKKEYFLFLSLLSFFSVPLWLILFHRALDGDAEVGGTLGHGDAGLVQRLDLVGGRATAAADDGARMAHALPRRSCLTGDERRHGFRDAQLDILRRAFLGRAANLTNQQDCLCLRIILKHLEQVNLRGADNRIAADADARRLTESEVRQLPDGLVGERPAAADDADGTGLVDVTGHDADFALSRRDDAWTVGTNQPTGFVLEETHGAGHVENGNALGDGDDEGDTGVSGLHDGVGRAGGRHENHGGVGPGLLDGLGHGIEEREAFLAGAALARHDAADD